jgi:phosphatidylserine decarboxylase
VLLLEPGKMAFDDDLVDNSNTALETLIRVGMSIGHSPDTTPVSEQKEHVTQEDIDDARRRIGGSIAPTAS